MDIISSDVDGQFIDKNAVKKLYGVEYIDAGISRIVESLPDDLYLFKTFVGLHDVTVERGDSIYFVSEDETTAYLRSGPVRVTTCHIATVIRGHAPENKSSTITKRTNLPYVNGCSTKQVFPPERPGDPTLQLLNIPPYSLEQAHHIHSTVRVVYILSGTGRSVVGMPGHCVTEELYPGKSIILQKMCPHHFETDSEHLIALPLHVFSSVGMIENNHPMYNGTHITG